MSNKESLWFSGMVVYYSVPSSCWFSHKICQLGEGECNTTPKYFVDVNWELAGYFREAIELRQRNPLSPYLFVLAMEFQAQMLKKRFLGCNDFKFHLKHKNMKLINCIFANDWIIFRRADLLPVQLMKSFQKSLKWFLAWWLML